jgi:hypothetical protein
MDEPGSLAVEFSPYLGMGLGERHGASGPSCSAGETRGSTGRLSREEAGRMGWEITREPLLVLGCSEAC